MIFGIGIDMVDVARMDRVYQNHGDRLSHRILSSVEQEQWPTTGGHANFLAKSFAAKEAFAKASGLGLRPPVAFQQLGVARNVLGKPYFVFAAGLREWMLAQRLTAYLSLSDEKNCALAMVILERIDEE